MRTAAVTMAWNEAERLPRWIRHYGREVGHENLFVLDDNSTDGATAALHPATVIPVGRTGAFDERARAAYASDFVTNLLGRYDTVVFGDVDELIAPLDGGPLRAALEREPRDTLTTLGFDVTHRLDREGPLSPDQPLLAQRRHARFNATYCKPLVVRAPIRWRPGFHFSDQPTRFGGLALFHTRYADLETGLRRLAQNRTVEMQDGAHNTHWREADERFRAVIRSAADAEHQPLTGREAATWEARLLARLEGAPRNAVEAVRDLPDIHPSWYRLDDRFAHVG